MKQLYDNYTSEDQEVWNILFERQEKNLKDKASQVYLDCLQKIERALNARRIPNFDDLSAYLMDHTGWSIEVVPGLIPVEDFFELLEQRKFCSSTWLRSKAQLDYLEEPDMFHDIFGHIPLLADQSFADFMQAFGESGVRVKDDPERVVQLQRLYWFTIEFGLIRESGDLKVYGAGIASSFGETLHSLGDSVEVLPFDLDTVLNRPFRNDVVQNTYFELSSFDQLFESFEAEKVKIQVGS